MFSTDDTTSLVGVMEEYGVKLNSIKNNIDTNSTLPRLRLDNILNQSYASRIANHIYNTESIGSGDLTKSLNNSKGLFSSIADTDNEHHKEDDVIKTETNNINSLLDGCKKLFVDSDITNNNAFNALVAENLLDSALRYHQSGIKVDSNGKVVSAINSVSYQNGSGVCQ